jgi:aromatic ring-opening dioxygenase catalytic subunit (LigB family)
VVESAFKIIEQSFEKDSVFFECVAPTQQFDTASLLNYRRLSPYAAQAHPRDEHLMPLFTALGACGEQTRPQAFYRGVSDIVIVMDGYQFQ